MASNSRIVRLANVIPDNDAAVTGWQDYCSRSNQTQTLTRFYSSDNALMQYDTVQKVLSVGSAEGDVDALLLARCPNLREYVGIEPGTAMCEEAYEKISSQFPDTKITLINGFFEDVDNIGNDFDAILFNHALYHFKYDMPAAIKLASKFLRPGGLIYIVTTYGILHRLAESTSANMDERIREALTVNNFKFKEEQMETIQVDMSAGGDDKDGFLSLFLLASIDQEKKLEILDRLEANIIPGTTNKVPHTQMLFVAQQK